MLIRIGSLIAGSVLLLGSPSGATRTLATPQVSNCQCVQQVTVVSSCQCSFSISTDAGYPKSADCTPYPGCQPLQLYCMTKGRVTVNCPGPGQYGSPFNLNAACQTGSTTTIPCGNGGSVRIFLNCSECKEPPAE